MGAPALSLDILVQALEPLFLGLRAFVPAFLLDIF